MLDLLVAVNPIFCKGVLYVSSKMSKTEHYFNLICKCVSYGLVFRTFSKTRWCGVGPSQRFMMLSTLVGCDELVNMAKPLPHVTGEDLNSYYRKSEQVVRYAAVAALGVYVPESVGLELLQDDRLASRFQEVKQVADDEFDYVMTLPVYIYEVFAQYCGLTWEGGVHRICNSPSGRHPDPCPLRSRNHPYLTPKNDFDHFQCWHLGP